MKRNENLLQALRRLQVETGSLACMGCGHEHDCGTRGCTIIREAAERLSAYEDDRGMLIGDFVVVQEGPNQRKEMSDAKGLSCTAGRSCCGTGDDRKQFIHKRENDNRMESQNLLRERKGMRMFILTSDNKSIMNADFVERFCVVRKPDATLIIASYSSERPAVTIGKYVDDREAQKALLELYSALGRGGADSFEMPDSVMFHGEKWERDARFARKGGS